MNNHDYCPICLLFVNEFGVNIQLEQSNSAIINCVQAKAVGSSRYEQDCNDC